MKFCIGLLLFSSFALHGQTTRVSSEQAVMHYAKRYNIEPEVIAAFIDVESGWNPKATSSKGAKGLMQLMPETARRYGARDPYDPDQNVAAGTRYITSLMWEFRGDLRLVAAAYNAGDKWVGRRMLGYRNPEVVAYVIAVRTQYVRRRRMAQNVKGDQR